MSDYDSLCHCQSFKNCFQNSIKVKLHIKLSQSKNKLCLNSTKSVDNFIITGSFGGYFTSHPRNFPSFEDCILLHCIVQYLDTNK